MLNSAPLNTAALNASEFTGYTTPLAWGLGGALNTSSVNGFSAPASRYVVGADGARVVYASWSGASTGARSIGYDAWARDVIGARSIPFGVIRSLDGTRAILAEWSRAADGAREMAERTYGRSVYGARSISVRYTRALSGARQQLRVWARTTTGVRSLDLATWVRAADGARLVGYSDWARTVDGSRVLLETFNATEIGYRRIADATLARFEVYRGVDAAPDLDGAPWETFTAAPHETAALDPGHTYRFVVRRRNAWNLISQNRDETVIVVDGTGELDIAPPSAPFGVAITPAAAGVMVVTASYGADADDDRVADTWLIYAAIGGDPDPETDVPATVAMSGGTVATLRYETPAFADGAAVHVVVRTRRTGPPVSDSVNMGAVIATAETQGPQSPAGQIFFGRTAAQSSD